MRRAHWQRAPQKPRHETCLDGLGELARRGEPVLAPLAIARRQIAATSSGTAGFSSSIGGGSSSVNCRRIASRFVPSTGGRPVSISYITAPRE